MSGSNALAATPHDDVFFSKSLAESDPELYGAVANELKRQQHEIELIASENIVSRAVLEAAGTVLTNKYAEGYPGKRYYGGCQLSTSPKTWRSTAPSGYSAAASPMCSRIPAPRPIRACCWRLPSRATRFSA